MDLLFLLDASGSSKFQNEFFKGTKEFIEGFLDEFVLDTFVNVGIISFANEVELNLPLKVHYYSLCQMKFTGVFFMSSVRDGHRVFELKISEKTYFWAFRIILLPQTVCYNMF